MDKYIKDRRFVFLLATLLCLCLCGCHKGNPVPEQMRQPGEGTVHVRMDVAGYGHMEFVLLKDAADEAVKDFTARAESGFYDGKPIYMVIKDFCIIAGENMTNETSTPSDTVPVSENEDGNKSSGKKSPEYYPFRGALCITDTLNNNTAEHFTVISTDTAFLDKLDELLAYRKITGTEYFATAYGVNLDDETFSLYEQYGGAPWLTGHCTVIGQMTAGFEVLDAISEANVSDDANFKPEEDIVIEKVTVY